jgi:competence protein ComEC
MNNKIFLSIIFGFLTGVFIGSLFKTTIAFVFLVATIALCFLILSLFNKNSRKVFLLVSIFIIFVSLGILRFYVKDISEPKNELDNFVGQNVTLDGFISDEIDTRQSSQRLLVSVDTISLNNRSYKINQKILVSTELFPEYFYGDKIKVSGKLQIPQNFITDIGKEFDYIDYLKKDSIFYTMSFGQVERVGQGEGNKLRAGILSIKKKFINSIENIIPSPESSLAGGLLLGTKQSLGEDLQQDFVNTGLVHIIVLSGYNVTIIAEALIRVLSFVSISFGIYVGGLAIIIFAIMTGAGATIIRASIMAILALVARATGRNYEILRALMLAAALMVLYNPYTLFYDISFQLSFMATLGLIFMSPIFKKGFKFIPEHFGLREIISATIGVQVFVLPFILYKMGNLSLIAPITNTLVLPLIPMTMFFGFAAGATSFIFRLLALPFAWLAYILLKFEILVVQTFSKLSFSTVKLAHFPFALVIIFYVGVGWYLFRYYKKHNLVLDEK